MKHQTHNRPRFIATKGRLAPTPKDSQLTPTLFGGLVVQLPVNGPEGIAYLKSMAGREWMIDGVELYPDDGEAFISVSDPGLFIDTPVLVHSVEVSAKITPITPLHLMVVVMAFCLGLVLGMQYL